MADETQPAGDPHRARAPRLVSGADAQFAADALATSWTTGHFGFQVEDLAETQARIEAAGGRFFFDLGDARKGNFERKFKDPA